MPHDVVALLDRRPTMRGLTRALVQASPTPRVRTVAEGADDPDGGYCDGPNGLPLIWDENAGFVQDVSRTDDPVPHPHFRAPTMRRRPTISAHFVRG